MSTRGERHVAGFHPVRELLVAGRPVAELRLARDAGERTAELRDLARQCAVEVVDVDRSAIDALTPDIAHQGVLAVAPAFQFTDLGDVLAGATARDGDPPLLVAADEITDPHNLGAIARTAEAVGADALIIPRRRSAGVSTVSEKAAAGAFAHLALVRSANIASALRKTSDAGLWTVGLRAGSMSIYDSQLLTEPLVLVVGSEGGGLAHLSQVRCDQLVALPLRGHVGSLNASVAAAVAMYEVRRKRDT